MKYRPKSPSRGSQFQHRVQVLFEQALDLPPDRRASWLDQQCAGDDLLRAEVAGLLSITRESETFLGSEQAEQSLRAIESIEPGESVGPYEVVREIGRGGMGLVLLARRADGQFEQQVALKLLKRGVNSEAVRAGFLRERQILAWLQHPNIARLYDGGITPEGHPWFALEYVEGNPITEYCEAAKLDAHARIDLVVQVCEAVQYAHRNLVIHRDLKPSNILVTDGGELKLLDFGIAAVLRDSRSDSPELSPQMPAMTPEYAAPEQLRNEAVTTAADIYALGILLHELLTGSRPGRGDPPSGNKAGRRLPRGDLDRILRKATHREAERRYGTAEAFADDLRRYLAGQPVSARPQTVVYRFSKFVQRNRRGLLVAAVVTAVILGATLFASHENAQARRERARARGVKDFLVNLVGSANPNAEGGAALRDEAILGVALERAETELGGEPDMQAELYDVVGKAYVARGDLASATAPLTKALELRRKTHGKVHPAVADAAYSMAALLRRQERFEEAETYYQEALDIWIALKGRQSLEASVLLNGLGANAYGAGDLDRAEKYYRESLAVKENLLDEDHEEIAAGRHNLALLLRKQGNYGEAETLIRLALRTNQRVYGDTHPITAMSHGGLGRILHETKRYDEAVREFRRAYEIRLASLGSNHPLTRLAQENLAKALYDAGDFGGAEEQLRTLLSMIELDLGKDSPEYARTLCDLADVLVALDRLDEAGAAYADAGEREASLPPQDRQLTGRVLSGEGAVALARGRTEDALAGLTRALAAYETNEQADTREGLGALVRRGECLSRLGRYSEADTALQAACRMSEDELPYTWEARLARNGLREHLIRAGRQVEASGLN